MKADQRDILNLSRLPARLSAEEVGHVLGFQVHDVPVLVGAGLLKPLGKPAQNGVKYFATTTVEVLGRDEKWLGRATEALRQHWFRKNNQKGLTTSDERTAVSGDPAVQTN